MPGHDGRLLVYALVDQAVLRWTQGRPGDPDWRGPDVVPAPDVTRLVVVQGGNRYAHLLGRRVREGEDGRLAVDFVYAIQYQAGRPVSEWREVGSPQTAKSQQLPGVPAAAVDTAGTLHVFAPTADGRIALRREDANGRWERWLDLGASAALDTPAAAVASTGRVELLAPGRAGLMTWCQGAPGAAPERGQDFPVAALPGSVTGLETSAGRITWYLTDVHNGGIVAVRAGEWPVPLGGDPGDGRHAALATLLDGHPCTVLAHRAADGGVVLGVCPAEDERGGVWWTETGVACLGDPALARDAQGRVVVLAVTTDGELALARQTGDPGLVLGDWIRI
ncbi:hypothetical protein [Streptomyces sp. NPDC021356]|uniref:hypothetical protein n=1 Tax=Streptomyces sp. NPDC021356 TaxID=3154900 RepID=UPI0033DDD6BD